MAGLVGLTTALIQGPDATVLPSCWLTPMDDTGTAIYAKYFQFQFYPETVEDNIQINYVDKDIPGLSHPLKQWTSNGGRTISFETVISRDIKPQKDLPGLVGLVVNPTSAENKKWNLDIRHAVRVLRSFCYPTYASLDSGVTVAKAPPVLELQLDGMALGRGDSDVVNVVMTGCDVSYEAAFDNGVPRRVRISLEFAEVIQIGPSIIPWDSAVDFDLAVFKDV